MLYHVIYFSKSTRYMNEEDLVDLLKECREWNKHHNLSGMLVYMQGGLLSKTEGSFMQVIEGTQEEVEIIFDKIKQDRRHHRITVLRAGALSHRNFTGWKMGFKSINVDIGQPIPGHFELSDGFMASTNFKNSSMALNFLKSFYMTHKSLSSN